MRDKRYRPEIDGPKRPPRRPTKDYRPDLDGPKTPMDEGDIPMSIMPIRPRPGRPRPEKPIRGERPNPSKPGWFNKPGSQNKPFPRPNFKPNQVLSDEAKKAALEMMRKRND